MVWCLYDRHPSFLNNLKFLKFSLKFQQLILKKCFILFKLIAGDNFLSLDNHRTQKLNNIFPEIILYKDYKSLIYLDGQVVLKLKRTL
jgi:hypothetical protein